MMINETPETIYLIPGEDWEGDPCMVWCDDPAPSNDHDPDEAVRYVRASRLAEVELERDAYKAAAETMQATATSCRKQNKELAAIAQHGDAVGEVAYMIHVDWEDRDNTKGVALVDRSLAPGTKVYTHPLPAQQADNFAERFAAAVKKAEENGYGQDGAYDDSWIDDLGRTLEAYQGAKAKGKLSAKPAQQVPEQALRKTLQGIDQTEDEHPDGWWETSTGAEFGAKKLAQVVALLTTQEPNND